MKPLVQTLYHTIEQLNKATTYNIYNQVEIKNVKLNVHVGHFA